MNSNHQIGALATAGVLSVAATYFLIKQTPQSSGSSDFDNILIGDVGGTNVRLQLIRLFHSDKNKREELKPLTKYSSQAYPSFIACVQEFLKGVDTQLLPRVGVVGMAGPVKDNKIPVTVNIPHWGVSDGNAVASAFKLDSFIFINDFTAAGYGISRVTNDQCKILNKGPEAKIIEGANSVKIVMGPGTGLGQGILIKVEEDGLYEPFPSEGGHVDFTVKNQDDWDLFVFA